MIRTATLADIPALVRMGRDFVETGLDVPYSETYFGATLQTWISQPVSFVVFVLELDGAAKGMLCAVAFGSPLVPMRIAVEQVFWIDPDARGHWANPFIDAYETWAKKQNCVWASLTSNHTNYRAGKLYQRRGYANPEINFSKVL